MISACDGAAEWSVISLIYHVTNTFFALLAACSIFSDIYYCVHMHVWYLFLHIRIYVYIYIYIMCMCMCMCICAVLQINAIYDGACIHHTMCV